MQDVVTPIRPGRMKLWLITYLPMRVVPERSNWIVARSDEVEMGAILAARELGIVVPSQLSVIGLDGHVLGPLFSLTTLAQHPEAQGRRAVEMILGAMRGEAQAPGEVGAEHDHARDEAQAAEGDREDAAPLAGRGRGVEALRPPRPRGRPRR